MSLESRQGGVAAREAAGDGSRRAATGNLNLEQIQALLDGCQSVSFQLDSQAAKYAVVNAVLQHHHYAGQPRAVKGLLRRFLAKLSGLSRAQLTRLIGQFLRERTVQPTAYRRRRFASKYTRDDIALLARVDRAHQQMSGPATCRILEREYSVYHREEFKRLAELSVSHLYNLRAGTIYRRHRLTSTRLVLRLTRSANVVNLA